MLPEPEFLASEVLYSDEDYLVTCVMPAQSACGAQVRMNIVVKRLRDTAASLTLRTAIQMPAFTDENGSLGSVYTIEAVDAAGNSTGKITVN